MCGLKRLRGNVATIDNLPDGVANVRRPCQQLRVGIQLVQIICMLQELFIADGKNIIQFVIIYKTKCVQKHVIIITWAFEILD